VSIDESAGFERLLNNALPMTDGRSVAVRGLLLAGPVNLPAARHDALTGAGRNDRASVCRGNKHGAFNPNCVRVAKKRDGRPLNIIGCS
jgi:hypothetical protein